MAPRSIATATVSFGLVSIPVKLFTTSQPAEGISFRMLHGRCRTPLKQQYVCPTDGEKVERDEIVKGYEFAKDQYVLFSTEEIKALEEETTKAIAIEEFVPLATVDPIYYDKAYYLAPDKGGDRAYKLLARALADTGLGGLARYAARGKQYIVLVRPIDGGLVMQQLRYAEEVRPFSEVPVGNGGEVKEAEMNLALQLLRQSAGEEFRPEKYVDETLARFREILQKKVEGEEITVAKADAPPAKVIDLMEALKASLAGGSSGATAGTGRPGKGRAEASEDAASTAKGRGPGTRRGPARAPRSGTGESDTGRPRARGRSRG